jgi:hypothetical protein
MIAKLKEQSIESSMEIVRYLITVTATTYYRGGSASPKVKSFLASFPFAKLFLFLFVLRSFQSNLLSVLALSKLRPGRR